MSCLGERLTALVDGELGHEERDRVLAHLAGCAQCRAEADELRHLKGRLRGLGTPAPDGEDRPSTDFMTRLLSLGDPALGPDVLGAADPGRSDPSAPDLRASDPDAATRRTSGPAPSDIGSSGLTPADLDAVGWSASSLGSAGVTRPDLVAPDPAIVAPRSRAGRPVRPVRTAPAGRPRAHRPPARPAAAGGLAHHRPRSRYLVVGAATLFIGLGAASYTAGGREDAPAVTPAFDRFAIEHALTSGDAPLTDPLTDPATQLHASTGP